MGDRQAFSTPRYSSAHGTSTGLRGETNEFQVVVLLFVRGMDRGCFRRWKRRPPHGNNASVRLLLSARPWGWALGRSVPDALRGH